MEKTGYCKIYNPLKSSVLFDTGEPSANCNVYSLLFLRKFSKFNNLIKPFMCGILLGSIINIIVIPTTNIIMWILLSLSLISLTWDVLPSIYK